MSYDNNALRDARDNCPSHGLTSITISFCLRNNNHAPLTPHTPSRHESFLSVWKIADWCWDARFMHILEKHFRHLFFNFVSNLRKKYDLMTAQPHQTSSFELTSSCYKKYKVQKKFCELIWSIKKISPDLITNTRPSESICDTLVEEMPPWAHHTRVK